MAAVAVVGAHTVLGAHVVAELARLGHETICASDSDRPTHDTPNRVVNTDSEIANLVTSVSCVVIVHTKNRESLVAACVTQNRPFVDLASEQHHVASYFALLGDTPCVIGAGLIPGIAELLIAATAPMLDGAVDTVTVAYTFPDRRFPPASLKGSAGRRRDVAGTLIHSGMQLQDGVWKPDLIGDTRTLMWFPRPVGPQQALAWPGVSRFTLPGALPKLTNFTQYMVVGSWRTEIFQALANMAAKPRFAARLTRRAAKGSAPADVTTLRFACVVEARSGVTFRRAWAYGRDPYALTAVLAGRVVTQILAGAITKPTSFVSMPAPHDQLDDLTAHTGLRWSVSDEIRLAGV